MLMCNGYIDRSLAAARAHRLRVRLRLLALTLNHAPEAS